MNLGHSYSGCSHYLEYYPLHPFTLLVAVSCRIGNLPDQELALLDTAAEWCVLTENAAVRLDWRPDPGSPITIMSTRFGNFSGCLGRIPAIFPAEQGVNLEVDATWFVAPDWPGPLVIGWTGCLGRMRFALDPSDQTFYFGGV